MKIESGFSVLFAGVFLAMGFAASHVAAPLIPREWHTSEYNRGVRDGQSADMEQFRAEYANGYQHGYSKGTAECPHISAERAIQEAASHTQRDVE